MFPSAEGLLYMSDNDRDLVWVFGGVAIGLLIVFLVGPWLPPEDHRPASIILFASVLGALMVGGVTGWRRRL